MQSSAPFRLNRSAMLAALISAAFAGNVEAAAARVDFTTTGATVAGRDGRARPLAKGAELDNGDTVRTNDGRVQLRFTDGSYVSLQPNTDFAISDYKYEGKSDDRGFFGLVRGAMRTVTGAVGRVNRNSYRITTPTATVGIRGTGGVVQVLPGGETLVIGTSGIWSLTNPAGSIDIPAGVSGLAPTRPNTPPTETNTQPQTSTAPVQTVKTEFKRGDDVNKEGKNETVFVATEEVKDKEETPVTPPPPPPSYVPLVSGPGYRVAAAHTNEMGSPSITFVGNQTATFDTAGRLTAFGATDIGSGSHANFGSDGILAWGRWTGTINVNGTPQILSADKGYHYVVGVPTATMPASSGATYTLVGASAPTYMNGHTVPGVLTSASVTAQYNGATTNITALSMTVAMPGVTYSMNGSSISNAGSLFSVNPTTTGCASLPCSATVLGFFSGASAQRMGLGYNIVDGPDRVYGAAALSK